MFANNIGGTMHMLFYPLVFLFSLGRRTRNPFSQHPYSDFVSFVGRSLYLVPYQEHEGGKGRRGTRLTGIEIQFFQKGDALGIVKFSSVVRSGIEWILRRFVSRSGREKSMNQVNVLPVKR